MLPERLAVFFGSWHPPNLAAARVILWLAPQLPQVQFVLGGTHGDAFPAHEVPDNVVFTGQVIERVKRTLLAAADVALNPVLHGSGTNLKVIEYLAAGVPVVSTAFGVRGLDVGNGRHLLVAEPPRDGRRRRARVRRSGRRPRPGPGRPGPRRRALRLGRPRQPARPRGAAGPALRRRPARTQPLTSFPWSTPRPLAPTSPRTASTTRRCSPLRRSRSRDGRTRSSGSRSVWRYRELLGNLIRKELKVKYKNSVLGFVWSLLNPMLYLVVFSIVFQEVLRVQIPYYAIFFLSGLLAWNFFATALSAGTGSIVGNAQLVQKVWFPREILPLAVDGRGDGALRPPDDRAGRRDGRLPAAAEPRVLPGARRWPSSCCWS